MKLRSVRDFTGILFSRKSINPANIVRPINTLRNEPEYARKKPKAARQSGRPPFRNFSYSNA